MNHEQQAAKNAENLARRRFQSDRYSPAAENCPACGSPISRRAARFCSVCGKILTEDYQPLDAFRSSYNLQGKRFEFERAEPPPAHLFEQNKNHVSQTARACLVYSTVPYLGILFVPFTFIFGGWAWLRAARHPHLGGGKTAAWCIYLNFVVLAGQLFLWWLLFVVPELGRRI